MSDRISGGAAGELGTLAAPSCLPRGAGGNGRAAGTGDTAAALGRAAAPAREALLQPQIQPTLFSVAGGL